MLSDELNRLGSEALFRLGLPVVLFFGAIQVDYWLIGSATYLIAGIVATLVVTLLSLVYAKLRGMGLADGAVFVQAAYRSNLGVIGIALAAQAYGEEGLALAALPVAVMTILYNLIAVPVLGIGFGKSLAPVAVMRSILTNPLIIGIGAGVGLSLAGIELSFQLRQAGKVFAGVVIPLSLVLIGASMDLRSLRKSRGITVDSTLWRLMIGPGIGVAVCIAMGVHGPELAVVFLLLASPAAAASYIMVAAAGGNGPLAANIVVITTLLSSATLTLGLAALQWSGLV